MSSVKLTPNATNEAGQPVDKEGNRIIDLTETKTYYVTESHPYGKELGGAGKAVKVSPHTHGPSQVKKGWLTESKPEGKKAKEGK